MKSVGQMLNTEILWWPGKNTYCDCPVTLQSALKQCDIRCGLCAYSLSNHVKMKEPIVYSRNTYLRNTMGQERMPGLALMKFYYQNSCRWSCGTGYKQTNFLCLICVTSEPLFEDVPNNPCNCCDYTCLIYTPLKLLYHPWAAGIQLALFPGPCAWAEKTVGTSWLDLTKAGAALLICNYV